MDTFAWPRIFWRLEDGEGVIPARQVSQPRVAIDARDRHEVIDVRRRDRRASGGGDEQHHEEEPGDPAVLPSPRHQLTRGA
jgi:hypothetical protein